MDEATIRTDSEIAVILLNPQGAIVDAHSSCADTLGWKREELIGRDIRELLQYGRELLMNQLPLLDEEERSSPNGHTSFSVRVLARRRDHSQFPARLTVRRFKDLENWTVAFYAVPSDPAEFNVPPAVSAEEISLAMRALEESTHITNDRKASGQTPKAKAPPRRDSWFSGGLWRNSRLLFSSKDRPVEDPSESVSAPEIPSAPEIEQEVEALLEQCSQPAEVQKPAMQAPAAVPAVPITERKMDEPMKCESKSSADPRGRSEWERQLSESNADITRLKSELEKERKERSRVEQRAASLTSQVQALHLQLSENLKLEGESEKRIAEMEQEVRDARDAAAEYKAGLQNEISERQATEDQLKAVAALNAQLESNLMSFEQVKATFQSTQAAIEDQLQASLKMLKETDLALEKETSQRQQAEQSLAAALREHRDEQQKSKLELSKLHALLQTNDLERGRLEEEILRSRAQGLALDRDEQLGASHLQAPEPTMA